MDEHSSDISDGMLENEDKLETLKADEDKIENSNNNSNNNGTIKKKYNPKDPSRPRHRKAKRAFYACQRAHLTYDM